MKGKISSGSFNTNTMIKSSAALDLIHTDFCGPMRATSLGGHKYYALFIDDYTRKLFIYFAKVMFSAFSKLSKCSWNEKWRGK